MADLNSLSFPFFFPAFNPSCKEDMDLVAKQRGTIIIVLCQGQYVQGDVSYVYL